ncbi:hypothetical protein QJS66_14010 [Kocuria rhizophila]|nr:hypothetical protein QJS66_14010 [Kocuria rhizophila]
MLEGHTTWTRLRGGGGPLHQRYVSSRSGPVPFSARDLAPDQARRHGWSGGGSKSWRRGPLPPAPWVSSPAPEQARRAGWLPWETGHDARTGRPPTSAGNCRGGGAPPGQGHGVLPCALVQREQSIHPRFFAGSDYDEKAHEDNALRERSLLRGGYGPAMCWRSRGARGGPVFAGGRGRSGHDHVRGIHNDVLADELLSEGFVSIGWEIGDISSWG